MWNLESYKEPRPVFLIALRGQELLNSRPEYLRFCPLKLFSILDYCSYLSVPEDIGTFDSCDTLSTILHILYTILCLFPCH